jgi:hypothetical protein
MINVFNVRSARNISSASLKDQCYTRDFYGKNTVVERALGEVEGAAAEIFRKIKAESKPPEQGSINHYDLMTFTVLQRARTQASAVSADEMIEKTTKKAYGPDLKDAPEDFRAPLQDPVLMAIRQAVRVIPATIDLQLHLLLNKSGIPFLTSDNPVVMHNTHNQHIDYRGSLGWGCSGLEAFLPLSPERCLYVYDAHVYKVEGRNERNTAVSETDVGMINGLQWLGAMENLYHAGFPEQKLQRDCLRHTKLRRAGQVVVHEAVAEHNPDHRLLNTFEPCLNLSLKLSFSTIRRNQRRQPDADRGRLREAVRILTGGEPWNAKSFGKAVAHRFYGLPD